MKVGDGVERERERGERRERGEGKEDSIVALLMPSHAFSNLIPPIAYT